MVVTANYVQKHLTLIILTINNKKGVCPLDTGAEVNLIHSEFLKKAGIRFNKSNPSKIHGVTGSNMVMHTYINIPTIIENKSYMIKYDVCVTTYPLI